MKRGGPLARKTPMKRGPIGRGSPSWHILTDETPDIDVATLPVGDVVLDARSNAGVTAAAQRALANRQRSIRAGSPALAPVPELSQPAPRPSKTGFPAVVRQIILERDNYCCVRCGIPIDTGSTGYSLQHRDNRGMGGTRDPRVNTPPNGLTMCGSGTTGCHGWTEQNPEEAERLGYAVPAWADPASVPVWVIGTGWMILGTGDCRYVVAVPTDQDARNSARRKVDL